MSLWLAILSLLGGGILLFVGADKAIDAAALIASRFGISQVIIGLTIVAIGTSLPELLVSVVASLSDSPDVALGNVIGSNISNILLVLGCAALLKPFVVKRSLENVSNVLLMALSLAAAYLFAMSGAIGRLEGGILLIIGVAINIWYFYLARRGRKGKSSETDIEDKIDDKELIGRPTWLLILVTVIGFTAVVGGSKLMVDGAVVVARHLGISELVIGLTIVALGTSLPELATSISAILKGKSAISFGNVIGSNIFNTTIVLGPAALTKAIPVGEQSLNIEIPINMGVSLLLLPFVLVGSAKLGRITGAIAITLYAIYILCLVVF